MEEQAYGSLLFYYNNDPNKPVRKLFIDRVLEDSVQWTEHGCLLWIGSLAGEGYPQMNITYAINCSGNISVARLLYQYENGPLNSNIHLVKCCLKDRCINPRHYKIQGENNG